MAGYVSTMSLFLLGTSLFFPPFGWVMRKFVLPKPGEGPSEKQMDRGFLEVVAHAVGTGGTKRSGMIYFPTDPGYRDTARMLVESALVLALDRDKVSQPGGVYTPGCCQGLQLLERLKATGTRFEYFD